MDQEAIEACRRLTLMGTGYLASRQVAVAHPGAKLFAAIAESELSPQTVAQLTSKVGLPIKPEQSWKTGH